ncbi:hypothetical protein CHLRE_13g580050v5 [Chlamydomonas reinhardtii]|uniref:AAA+ ATPase domain-containing protein n=1 Tax=Chlamydomonas reinhardtii TaxID=3055 RepID=A0A2K3D0B8_CHLRE|nr:uncharacterized protein CHLRE_13g580050v5 [Chlamydomonas reinhardtii]XP_042917522.1 uncharacterized protein CHLRE_13g580050v5 [Chlamydomonas reinhardtii]PNW73971.1 hypothetical protein CHLRE_13g580050v5 [Chlamydomonas reinhardtii]PNW73972.1 hypothetical protein CHLRE_13g580050v5 [Chlamydomonas reinhardtii]
MEVGHRRSGRLWLEVATQAVALGAMIWGLKICLQYLDPYREQREQAKKRAAFLKRHLGRTLELNEFEQLLAAQVMNPDHIEVEMGDVSGLEDIVADLETKVLYPLLRPELYRTTLWKQAKGVLLYGPPGTGKTMLAKALAKQSHCFFLNITASSIMSKWLGDANRLVRAVFSLAAKMEPCIIFIDEVDAMLGKRGQSSEHEATLQVKTEFMQLWDGMESSRGQRVVVMGATNRPWMVDEAVLRRFTLMYEVGLPGPAQRRSILTSYLRKHNTEVPGSVAPELLLPAEAEAEAAEEPASGAASTSGNANGDEEQQHQHQRGVAGLGNGLGASTSTTSSTSGSSKARSIPHAPASKAGAKPALTPPPPAAAAAKSAAARAASALDGIISATQGFSGSDLLELCSQAAQAVLAEHLHTLQQGGREDAPLRPLLRSDLEAALAHVRPSSHRADEYSGRVAGGSFLNGGAGGDGAGGVFNPADLSAALSLLLQLRGTGAGSGIGGSA